MIGKDISRKCFSKQAGFTMTELLVVIFIISLLTISVLISYRGSKREYSLKQATQQLISNLRRVQNMAMSGVDISVYNGYGIFAQKNDNYYIIYADANDDSTYQPTDTTIETIHLPDNVEINDTSPLSNKIDVFFEPPEPTTYINSNSGIGVSGTITLKAKGSSKTKTVTVTTAGLIQKD
jgi:prepilin-type N-terminal cleavage/methylation domain-containing protein